SSMDFHRDALTDFVFVDSRTERDHGAHIFMTWREVLVEGHAALNRRGRPVINDFEIGGADRDGVDTNQHFATFWYRYRLVLQFELTGIAENPSFHLVRDRKVPARSHASGRIHSISPLLIPMAISVGY